VAFRIGGHRSPIGWAKQRFERWWQSRHVATDSWTLTQNNIYILPTRAGLAFALTLLVLLVASINYQLSLGYLLTFLLAGSGLVSMNLTHATLRGLTLRLRPPEPAFAGEAAFLEIVLTGTASERYGIGLRARTEETTDTWTWVDVPVGGRSSARVSFVPHLRGRHAVPVVMAETRFPFGLFRAWTLWRPASQVLVYPSPERPPAPLPAAQSVPSQSSHRQRSEGGEFEGVRAWQRGDSMRRVVWKKMARAGELVSRDTHASTRQQLWLDYAQARGLPSVEQRLSRLAAWVLAADRAGAEWGLRLPGTDLPPGHGDVHRRAGLEALALWS
jgi:uncharacterized protein (DUF58 family)